MKPVGRKECSFFAGVCSCQTCFHRDGLGGEQRRGQISTATGGHSKIPTGFTPVDYGFANYKLHSTTQLAIPTGFTPVDYRFEN